MEIIPVKHIIIPKLVVDSEVITDEKYLKPEIKYFNIEEEN